MSPIVDLQSEMKDRGILPGRCPRCKKVRPLVLYRCAQRPIVKGWPLPRLFTAYTAVCPRCTSVYRVAPAAAKLWLSGALPDPYVSARFFHPLPAGEPVHQRKRDLIFRPRSGGNTSSTSR